MNKYAGAWDLTNSGVAREASVHAHDPATFFMVNILCIRDDPSRVLWKDFALRRTHESETCRYLLHLFMDSLTSL